MKAFAQYSDHNIDSYANPYLRFDSIGRRAVKGFDSEMLLDPFEEQLHLPAASVELGDDYRGLGHVVGQEHQLFGGFRIGIPYPSKSFGILTERLVAGQDNSLVEANAGSFVDRRGVASTEPEIAFCASYKKCHFLMDAIKPCKVDIGSVHDVERTDFENQLVEDIHIVNLAGGNNDKGWEVSLQGQKRVQFDGRLGSAKLCPREHGKTQIDHGSIQGVGRIGQLGSVGFPLVEFDGLCDQHVCKIAEYSPVAFLVGIRQGASRHWVSNARMVELRTDSFEACLDVPQTLPIRQLGKTHDLKLVVASQFSDAFVAVVTGDAFVEFVLGDEVHQLREYSSPFLHDLSPLVVEDPKSCHEAFLN